MGVERSVWIRVNSASFAEQGKKSFDKAFFINPFSTRWLSCRIRERIGGDSCLKSLFSVSFFWGLYWCGEENFFNPPPPSDPMCSKKLSNLFAAFASTKTSKNPKLVPPSPEFVPPKKSLDPIHFTNSSPPSSGSETAEKPAGVVSKQVLSRLKPAASRISKSSLAPGEGQICSSNDAFLMQFSVAKSVRTC